MSEAGSIRACSYLILDAFRRDLIQHGRSCVVIIHSLPLPLLLVHLSLSVSLEQFSLQIMLCPFL